MLAHDGQEPCEPLSRKHLIPCDLGLLQRLETMITEEIGGCEGIWRTENMFYGD